MKNTFILMTVGYIYIYIYKELKVPVKLILLFTVHLVHFKFLKQCHTINNAETIQVTYQGHVN
jgi:hypothetical protein